MSFAFGKTSLQRLDTLDRALRLVVVRALQLSTQDFMVLEGVRTLTRQHQLYGKGRTREQLAAKGINPMFAEPHLKPVTWTLNSRHLPNALGLSEAVDLAPFPLSWTNLPAFDAVARAMFAAAEELRTPIRWGADWDGDGNLREAKEHDSPHFELDN